MYNTPRHTCSSMDQQALPSQVHHFLLSPGNTSLVLCVFAACVVKCILFCLFACVSYVAVYWALRATVPFWLADWFFSDPIKIQQISGKHSEKPNPARLDGWVQVGDLLWHHKITEVLTALFPEHWIIWKVKVARGESYAHRTRVLWIIQQGHSSWYF